MLEESVGFFRDDRGGLFEVDGGVESFGERLEGVQLLVGVFFLLAPVNGHEKIRERFREQEQKLNVDRVEWCPRFPIVHRKRAKKSFFVSDRCHNPRHRRAICDVAEELALLAGRLHVEIRASTFFQIAEIWFFLDVFFDDQAGHCEKAREVVATGHVPHGISNELKSPV